ncbi:MAG: TIM-barrel domain-containing protein, partial [Alistipes finegoldii]
MRALGGDRYEITTEALRIVYEHDGFPFGLHNFAAYYKLNGKEKKFTNRCIFRNNLGGPVETLDRVTGEIPMQDGLLSRDGWYVIDDERSDLLVDGWLCPRDTKSHVQDQYCFVYGNDYKAALADLGAISGRVPMTRKYIHGVWYCRYWDYTSEEFLSIIDGYEENDFPLDNLVFDMGWHTYTARTGTGHAGSRSWTGYTGSANAFRSRSADRRGAPPRRDRVAQRPSARRHPSPRGDVRRLYEGYGGRSGQTPFDLGDRKYMETFFKHAHHTTEDMGVDFWWLDWQQNYLYPEVRGYRSTSLQWINELYYRQTERKGLRGAGYSRWAGWGDHRHPIQFSGDAQANWEMLAFEVKLTAASGNAGCYYWAHDIGGFRGDPNPELTVRWT